MCWSGCEATLKSAKITSIVCDETMEKMRKLLNLWFQLIQEKYSTQRCCAKKNLWHVRQGQENGEPFSNCAGWLTCFKRQDGIKNAKCTDDAGSNIWRL